VKHLIRFAVGLLAFGLMVGLPIAGVEMLMRHSRCAAVAVATACVLVGAYVYGDSILDGKTWRGMKF